jgi:predicted phage tail protein
MKSIKQNSVMRNFKFILIIIAGFIVWSCTKDFIVKDIKNGYVTILAPSNNLVTPNNSLTFWWEEMDGAEKYNIQIVTPNFSAIQQLVTDTNIIGTKFTQSFTPGSYQWRIRGVNAGGNSEWMTYDFKIDTTSNLAFLTVSPTSPANNYLTKDLAISFSWNSLSSATNYSIEITDSTTNATITGSLTSATSFTHTFTAGGVYYWKVKAINAFSVSQYNSGRKFTIDLTAPSPAPSLISPSHTAFVSLANDSLVWTRNGNGALYDSLYISYDTNFAAGTVIASARVNDTKKKLNAITPTLSTTAYPYYWWRVVSKDSMGNRAVSGNQRKFKLNP